MREYPINWREYFLTSYRNQSDISYGIGSCHETSCLIESTGNISCIEPCSYVAHCKTDYTLWPYDKQNCSMMFGPWMSSDAIDYVGDSAVISYAGAAQHTQWKLVSALVSKKVLNSTKMPNLFYVFTIERHSALITKVIGRRFYGDCTEILSPNIFGQFLEIPSITEVLNENLKILKVCDIISALSPNIANYEIISCSLLF